MSISEKLDRPVYNNFIEIAHERAWEVAQEDYQDRISVTRAISSLQDESLSVEQQDFRHRDEEYVELFLEEFNSYTTFDGRLELYCKFRDSFSGNDYITRRLEFEIRDPRFKDYYGYLGTITCKAHHYRDNELKELMVADTKSEALRDRVKSSFELGYRYSSKDIKSTLNQIYSELSINRKAKATDISEWFVAKAIQIWKPEENRKIAGFEIVS
jgi:hypothetical protein